MAVLGFSFFAVQNIANVVIAIPSQGGTYVSIEAVEGINDRRLVQIVDDMAITSVTAEAIQTYENRVSGVVTAINVNHTVQLIGTNHSYPFVMGREMVAGGFFTRDAFYYRHLATVINEAAAFSFFGSTNVVGETLQINGQLYTVVGVISSEGDATVYIPAPLLGTQVEAVAASLQFNSFEEIVNQWTQIGITEARYEFINLGIMRQVVQDRLWLSFAFIVILCCVSWVKITTKKATKQWQKVQSYRRDMYAKELLRTSVLWVLLYWCVLAVVNIGIVVYLILVAFEKILLAYASRGMLSGVSASAFSDVIINATWLNNLSLVFFCGVIVLLVYQFFLHLPESAQQSKLIKSNINL